MSRDFFCVHCGHRIEVADSFPNRTILCPSCGRQMPVLPMPMHRVEPSEPTPTHFTIGELFQDAWNIGTKCWQPFLIMGAIIGGLNFFCFLGGYIGTFVSVFIIGARVDQVPTMGIDPVIAFIGIFLTVALVLSLVMVWLYSGAFSYSLAIVRGEQPPVSVLFSGMKNFWKILITGANISVIQLCAVFVILVVIGAPLILYGASNLQQSPDVFFVSVALLWIVGFVTVFIFGILVALMFCLSYFFVVDRQQGPVEAMKSSYRYVRADFWKVLGAVILIILCSMVAGMVPMVGMVLTVPVSLCLNTVLYLKITGQKHGLSP